MAHLAFIFCCVVWGTTFILLERVTHVFGPVEIGIFRFLSGAAAVAVFWWPQRREFRLARRDWITIILLSLAFTAPPQVILSYVLAQGFGHSFFGTIVAVIPLLTILVSIPMLGILPTGRELVGVLGGLLCMWLMVEDGVDRGMSLGLLALTFTIPLTSALSNTLIKRQLPNIPAAPLTTLLLLVAGLALVPLQLSPPAMSALHLAAPVHAQVTATAVVYLLLLGVMGSGISTLVFIWMILKRGPLFAGMTTYVVPVLALLWGTVDHETISPRQMVAIAGVLSMVALVQSGSRRPLAAPKPALPEAIADAMAPLHLVPAPQLVVAPVPEFVSPDLMSQPDAQVA